MERCLCCYGELTAGESALHQLCVRRLFSAQKAPQLPYSAADIAAHLGEELVVDRASGELRFGAGRGQYSLLEASGDEVILESVTMRMADMGRVAVTPHTQISSTDGVLHHLRRAVDHGKKGSKIEIVELSNGAQNDRCEAVAEEISKLSTTPKLDIINLYERLLFGYLVGDTKLDAKSFKMAKSMCGSSLAPALSIMPNSLMDKSSEMALSIGGKRGDFTRSDFEDAMKAGGIEPKIIENIFQKFEKMIDPWCELIDSTSLSEELKDAYKFQVVIRFDML